MWKNLIRIVCFSITTALTACHHTDQPPSPVETEASLCEIFKQKLISNEYQTVDPVTMKRKNAVDQAELVNEYNRFDCPEITDDTPPP